MQKTENYNLNQWESHDEIKVEDFNADNAAVDAALGALSTAVADGVKLQTGSYKGNGKYGSSNPNTLTFDFQPKFLIIWGPSSHMLGMQDVDLNLFAVNTSQSCTTTWSGNTVQWYNGTSEYNQMNYSAVTYYFFAIG